MTIDLTVAEVERIVLALRYVVADSSTGDDDGQAEAALADRLAAMVSNVANGSH